MVYGYGYLEGVLEHLTPMVLSVPSETSLNYVGVSDRLVSH